MEHNIFSPMEIDAIGEIMNISLGSSATAVSNMLDHRVDITTPKVTTVNAADLVLGKLEPAIGVEIRYVSGLDGSNIMLLKRGDVKAIVDILFGTETADEDFELNELTISAVCEVMNQMMGAASTALSDFLGRMVNISTPQSFELDNFDDFKAEHFPPSAGILVVVRFTLTIEGSVSSEFVNVISVALAKELISGFGLGVEEYLTMPEPDPSNTPLTQDEIEQLIAGGAGALPKTVDPTPNDNVGGMLSQAEIERLMSGIPADPNAPPPPPPPASSGSGMLTQEEIERLMSGGMPSESPPPPPPQPPMQQPPMGDPNNPYMGYPPPGAYPPPYGFPPQGYYPPPPGYYYPPEPQREPPEPKLIPTQAVHLPRMDVTAQLGEEQSQNLDLIMSVPLEVSVEIGRTHRKVQDILSFTKGSLVILDKLAGDQVDLYVNGQCIAKGDVVVVDDNFGIRITEILKPPESAELLGEQWQ